MHPATPGSVNPYAPPTPERQQQPTHTSLDYFREGNDLVVRKGARLPEICPRTGEPTQGRLRTKNLSWIPPWTTVVFVFNPLVGLICMLVARKTAMLTFSLSEEGEAKRKQGLMIGLGVFAIGGAVIVGGLAMESYDDSRLIALLGGVGLLVGIILAAVLYRPYQLRKMAGDYVYLRIEPVALEAFEAYRTQHVVVAATAPTHSAFG